MDGTSLEFRPTGDQAYLKTKEQGTPNIRRRNIYVLVNQFACLFFLFFFNVLLCFAVQVFWQTWLGPLSSYFHCSFSFLKLVWDTMYLQTVWEPCVCTYGYTYTVYLAQRKIFLNCLQVQVYGDGSSWH